MSQNILQGMTLKMQYYINVIEQYNYSLGPL